MTTRIKVGIRIRPLLENELKKGLENTKLVEN